MFAQLAERTGETVDHESEVGGLDPVATSHELELSTDPDSVSDGAGYTELEAWLHGLAATVEGRLLAVPGEH